MFSNEIKLAVKQHALSEKPNECCGLIVAREDKIFTFPCRNTGENRGEHFVINIFDYLKATQTGTVCGFYHSQEDKVPSILDELNCNGHNMPSLIYSWKYDHFIELIPNNDSFKKYLNRNFRNGTSDCFSLVRDFYQDKLNINIHSFQYVENWYEDNPNLIVQNIEKEGFYKVDIKEIKKYDIILFKIRGDFPSHMAIYLGKNLILHQLQDKKSCIEFLDSNWRKRIYCVVRYHETE